MKLIFAGLPVVDTDYELAWDEKDAMIEDGQKRMEAHREARRRDLAMREAFLGFFDEELDL